MKHTVDYMYVCRKCGTTEVFSTYLSHPPCPCGGRMILYDELPRRMDLAIAGMTLSTPKEICLHEDF